MDTIKSLLTPLARWVLAAELDRYARALATQVSETRRLRVLLRMNP